MTKAELVSAMAEQSGLTKKDSAKAVEAFTSVVAAAMRDGDKVQIVGFGSFVAVDKAARTGRNPQTGETIQIAACKAPKFKAGKALKDAVNA